MKRMRAYKTYANFDEFLADQTAANRAIIRELRRPVKSVAPGLHETSKWGNGCWVKGKENVAYVHPMPDHVQFGFFGGSALKDPRGLLEGKGRYVRFIPIPRHRRAVLSEPLETGLRVAMKGFRKAVDRLTSASPPGTHIYRETLAESCAALARSSTPWA